MCCPNTLTEHLGGLFFFFLLLQLTEAAKSAVAETQGIEIFMTLVSAKAQARRLGSRREEKLNWETEVGERGLTLDGDGGAPSCTRRG